MGQLETLLCCWRRGIKIFTPRIYLSTWVWLYGWKDNQVSLVHPARMGWIDINRRFQFEDIFSFHCWYRSPMFPLVLNTNNYRTRFLGWNLNQILDPISWSYTYNQNIAYTTHLYPTHTQLIYTLHKVLSTIVEMLSFLSNRCWHLTPAKYVQMLWNQQK